MNNILHCDLNNFYASVECLKNPEFKNRPLAVCGSIKERHGIVLAKNYLAKEHGVFTGQTYIDAERVCPNIVIVKPHFDWYLHYSKLVRKIYLQYTDFVEPFGIDEAWLDISHSKVFGTSFQVANEIRKRVFKECGLTISVGASFNKVFAKLGSDLKKPNAVTVIDQNNFKDIVWKQDIEKLYGIGYAINKKLKLIGINTVGELAKVSKEFLLKKFGKIGEALHDFSNGIGNYPVKNYYEICPPKSVGNSTTSYKDLNTITEIKDVLMQLCENIASRCLSYEIKFAKSLCLYIKDSKFNKFNKQTQLNSVVGSNALFLCGLRLYENYFSKIKDVRSLGISISGFENEKTQLDMFSLKTQKALCLDETIKHLKFKFGENIIMRGSTLTDKNLIKKFHN